MLLMPEWNKPLIVDSLTAPMVAKYFWTFSGPMLDFTLSPINYLEETIGPSIELTINEFTFKVPSSWYILISDPETYQLDTVPISSCVSSNCHAVCMSPDDSKHRIMPINFSDFEPNSSLISPMVQKGMMMQHPVGIMAEFHTKKEINLTVAIGPHDLYKFIENGTIGDIF